MDIQGQPRAALNGSHHIELHNGGETPEARVDEKLSWMKALRVGTVVAITTRQTEDVDWDSSSCENGCSCECLARLHIY